jgi:hypothetical protein
MTINYVPFTSKMNALVDEGKIKTEQLKTLVEVALGVKKLEIRPYRHTYIQSPPGAGKTFTVLTTALENNIKLEQVRGFQTLPDFVAKMCKVAYVANGKPVTVWIDDCDSLFYSQDSINVMKNMLDQEIESIEYNAKLGTQRNRLLESDDPDEIIQGEALLKYKSRNGDGISCNVSNITCLITSNKELVSTGELEAIRNGQIKGKKYNKMMPHEAAIVSRVNYKPIDLTPDESWGWIAYLVLNNNILRETDMRAVNKLAGDMINHPSNFPDYWSSYLRKIPTQQKAE